MTLKYINDDIEIAFDSVHISPTYAGCFMGTIQDFNKTISSLLKNRNASISEILENTADTTQIQHGNTNLWGGRPTTIVYPKDWNEEIRLPDTMWTVWLTSKWVSEQYQHGSHLFLVGFCDTPLNVFESIEATLTIIDWKQESNDFEY